VKNFENLLHKYAANKLVDWTEVAKESITKHNQGGMVLRGARFRENLSQKELAEQSSGYSQDNISRMENGKRKVGEKVAKKLAKVLKINYDLLLEKDS
jgi:ribosome-binding protein aMBF1 (putative translation factor)